MLSGVRSAARKKLFRADTADLLAVDNWSETTGGAGGHQQQQHWWAALEHNFVLEATDDEYGGVVVDADRLPVDKAAFARRLAASLSYWKSVVRPRPHFPLVHPIDMLFPCFSSVRVSIDEALSICSDSLRLMLQGKKGVWLKLPVDRAEFVPLAVKVLQQTSDSLSQ